MTNYSIDEHLMRRDAAGAAGAAGAAWSTHSAITLSEAGGEKDKKCPDLLKTLEIMYLIRTRKTLFSYTRLNHLSELSRSK